MVKKWNNITEKVSVPTEPTPPDYEDLPDVIKENALEIPYHPQVQFLKDVDGDGLIDHLYCCEAASLEYLNATGHEMNPIDLETHDTLTEYTRINRMGPDAGWGAAVLAIIDREPHVYGPQRYPSYWAATYRIPAHTHQMSTRPHTVNHDLLVIGVDDEHVYLHCTYNGPCKVTRKNFNQATLMLTTTQDHDPIENKDPATTAEHILNQTDAPIIATVNAQLLNPVEKLGTLPFIVTVEKDWKEDWKEGLTQPLPPTSDDRICYLAAILKKDQFPIYTATQDWLKWLKENENKIVNPQIK